MNDEKWQRALTTGLTSGQVGAAIEAGEVNIVRERSSRPVSLIIRANIFTLFNAILTGALIVVLLVGNWQDAVFGFVMVANSLIGIISELRAKRTLDSLAILEAPRALVVRDGQETEIPAREIVRGDLVHLSLGDQIPVDGSVVASRGLRVDESMLTGESRPVHKEGEDQVLSGTAVVAGQALIVAEAVGANAYAQQLTEQARRFKQAKSEIADGINKVLAVISWVIVPVVALLVWSQLTVGGDANWRHALVLAIAGVVGMIPQGLVLLTSLNFALAAAELARRKVLVQELNAVEVLARVDRLCLDKTGTITTGQINGREIVDLTEDGCDQARQALAALVGDGGNETAKATLQLVADVETLPVTVTVPFDSARKWSAVVGGDHAWVLGAPEIVLSGAKDADRVLEQVTELAGTGARVMCLAAAPGATMDAQSSDLPAGLVARALVVLEEEIRSDAATTLEYFARQGVGLKVISGDNPATVAHIARRVGLARADGEDLVVYDARELPTDPEELRAVVRGGDVFGRVTPEIKQAMVAALQADGHTVAMTGDGVNDVLALKDADLGIAMGSGATATKSVAKIVLVDGRFSLLPSVVGKGRQIIANMERVSTLFLTKTIYSALLAVIVAALAWRYPFLPRHLTIIGSLTIGIPAFFLALATNHRRYRKGFLGRTLSLAIPAGVTLAGASLVIHRLWFAAGAEVAATLATLTIVGAGLYLLGILSRPLVPWRIGLLATMGGAAVAIVFVPVLRTFFALDWPTPTQWQSVGVAIVLTWLVLELIYRIHQRYYSGAMRMVTSGAERDK